MVKNVDTDQTPDVVFDDDDITDGFSDTDTDSESFDDDPLVDLIVPADLDPLVTDEPTGDPDDTDESVDASDDDIDKPADLDHEPSLDDVLLRTVRPGVVLDDPDEPDDDLDDLDDELPPPIQPTEFRCKSCRLLKAKAQLADPTRLLCRDCV